MNIKYLNQTEKKKILAELANYFGITSLPFQLIETGKKKIRGFSGDFSKEDIEKLSHVTNIELIGSKDITPRISFDALPLFKDQLTKNILEINKEQLALWLRGYDLEIPAPRGPIVIKYQDDFIGMGKSNTEKIFNYVPKERKLKSPLPKN